MRADVLELVLRVARHAAVEHERHHAAVALAVDADPLAAAVARRAVGLDARVGKRHLAGAPAHGAGQPPLAHAVRARRARALLRLLVLDGEEAPEHARGAAGKGAGKVVRSVHDEAVKGHRQRLCAHAPPLRGQREGVTPPCYGQREGVTPRRQQRKRQRERQCPHHGPLSPILEAQSDAQA
eukprot:CAMPEP_0118859418 /NCGR_PEP_ID=MMETSP1163-20130328/5673_1 /TAXON_ID=124430 /ORGANISM="Phaeomonas parva, Strain CCMP2877" /LENGTH=181 /DNA_ID=CAMNT_0006793009 /DNA_START=344 /DNA_END=890 /DNA_ORIENTATION=-